MDGCLKVARMTRTYGQIMDTYSMYDFYVSMNHNHIVWSDLMEDRLSIP